MDVGLLTMTGRVVDTYEVYAASGTTYWASTTSYKATCTTNCRWFLQYAVINRDASSTVTVTIKNSSNEILGYIGYDAANTGLMGIPFTVASKSGLIAPDHIILTEGDYIDVAFGAAQGTGAYANFRFIEIGV